MNTKFEEEWLTLAELESALGTSLAEIFGMSSGALLADGDYHDGGYRPRASGLRLRWRVLWRDGSPIQVWPRREVEALLAADVSQRLNPKT